MEDDIKWPASLVNVEDTRVHTAEELLDELSPRATLWNHGSADWIFRGQENADWGLTPTGKRGVAGFRAVGVTKRLRHTEPSWAFQRDLTEEALIMFRDGLNRSGLTVPAESPLISERERRPMTSNAEPPPAAYPLMALAQHHGVPTHLLDWSRRPYVAAYFAAAASVGKSEQGVLPEGSIRCLAVWAMNRGFIEKTRGGIHRRLGDLFFYEAPTSVNPNMHAQDGLFTVLFDDANSTQEQHLASRHSEFEGQCVLRRFILPVGESPRLLRLLAGERVDGASLFPGADGVVRAMRERAYWEARAPSVQIRVP